MLISKNLVFSFTSDNKELSSTNHIPVWLHSITSLPYTVNILVPVRKPYLHLYLMVAARSKAWVCGFSLVGIAGSNPAGGMDICLVYVVCVLQVEVNASG